MTSEDVLNPGWWEHHESKKNESYWDYDYELACMHIAVQVTYILVCLLGLFGNTLVIYVVLRFSKMQTVTNMFILNLAVADECFLIGLPFLIVTLSLQQWPFGQLMCKIYMASTSTNQFTSSIFLALMSADRYIAVCHPIFAPRIRTTSLAKMVCFTVWIGSIIFMVPVYLYSNTMTYNNVTTCNIIWPENNYIGGQTAFTIYTFLLGFFIPVTLIFVFYFKVIMKLRTVGPENRSNEMKKSHRRVTKLILVVIIVYLLCWVPYWVTQFTLIYHPPKTQHQETVVIMHLLAGCLAYSNSAMNPCLYVFISDNFKQSFFKACACLAGKPNTIQRQIVVNCLFSGPQLGPDRYGSKLSRQSPQDEIKMTDYRVEQSTANNCRSSATINSEL